MRREWMANLAALRGCFVTDKACARLPIGVCIELTTSEGHYAGVRLGVFSALTVSLSGVLTRGLGVILGSTRILLAGVVVSKDQKPCHNCSSALGPLCGPRSIVRPFVSGTHELSAEAFFLARIEAPV
jgi:hypothetical protein